MTAPRAQGQLRSILLGGVLPVVAFTAIDSFAGVVWGLLAGMAFGAGEIIWEWRTQGKVDTVTWIANGMILVLGGVSLITDEGVWFKLQPAILEAAMAAFLWGSLLIGRPLVGILIEKQLRAQGMELHQERSQPLRQAFFGMTLRFGLFLAIHAVLATWAALHWSNAAWAALKGIGFTGSMIAYLGVEAVILRKRIKAGSERIDRV